MIGYGEAVGSGMTLIRNAWEEQGWAEPSVVEDHRHYDVITTLSMVSEPLEHEAHYEGQQPSEKIKALEDEIIHGLGSRNR